MSAPSLTVPVKVLPHGQGLALPAYATEHAAGMDLVAAVASPIVLAPQARVVVPTGIACAIPPGWEGQVRPRSGLALKHGITCANAVGTIDADYRGEIGVILTNLGAAPFSIERGMRIAQLVFCPVGRAAWQAVEELPDTARGTGGFGSTGVNSSSK